MAWVWGESRSRKTERLVLLAIADCAAEDGSNAYPSMAELMRKTGLSERGVQGAIKKLVELGELFVNANGGPRGCNRYRVIMATPHAVPPQEVHPADPAPAGDAAPPQETTPTPAASAPGTVLDPSEKKISSSKRSSEPRGSRLPEPYDITDEMREWVRKHCPDVRLPEHDRFCDYWRGQPGAKGRKADWFATWRNWMRKAQDDIPRRSGSAIAVRDGPQQSTGAARASAGIDIANRLRQQREEANRDTG